ncbi:MAG: hypothetical protein AAF378_19135, partial [Cyanobacteria bacterium P01_A01_bin.84]
MLQPDSSTLKARNTLLTMFVVLCILDATLVAIARDKWAIGRILLTIVVMYFVLQGRRWAMLNRLYPGEYEPGAPGYRL